MVQGWFIASGLIMCVGVAMVSNIHLELVKLSLTEAGRFSFFHANFWGAILGTLFIPWIR